MCKDKIKIIGIGGAGCHVVSRLIEAGLPGIEFIAVDTDWACVRASNAHHRIDLRGVSIYGLGSGGHPVWAKKCAQVCANELQEVISGAELTVIVAGMGGGTGSGAAPVVARIAGEADTPVVTVVTLPLDMEGLRRSHIAKEGLEALNKETGAVLVVPLEQILKETGSKISVAEFYAAADRVLCDRILFLIGKSDATEFAGLLIKGFQVIQGHESAACRLPDGFKKRLGELSLTP